MKKSKIKITSILLLALSIITILTTLPTQSISAWSANWGASTGGGFDGGVSGFTWNGSKQGARITIVDATSGAKAFGPSSTINVTSQNISQNTVNFGTKTKLEYRSSPSMNKTASFQVHKYSSFPKLVANASVSLSTARNFVTTTKFHKDVLVKYIPALKEMGETQALAELASGKYKIILEPWVVTQINGVEHCVTATEAALIDLQNGGKLGTHLPKRGAFAANAPALSHDWLPKSAYLTKAEFGIQPFAGESKYFGEYKVGTRLGKEPLLLNGAILDMMGIAVISIIPEIKIPQINLMINEFDGTYNEKENEVTLKASAKIDPGYPWKVSSDNGKTWHSAPMPATTNHYVYLQWGSDWDVRGPNGMGQEYTASNSHVFSNGQVFKVTDRVTGLPEIKIKLPEIPEGETFFVAKYSVNPSFNAPRFPTDPWNRSETTKQDNYAYLIFEVPESETTNFKMLDENYKDKKPNSAKYNPTSGTLDVRTIAVLDRNKDKEEIIPAQVKITIKNLTHPGKNEFTGMFPYKDFNYDEPVTWLDLPSEIPVGTGMEVTAKPNISSFKIETLPQEQELHIIMEVNPEDTPTETDREDNIWETKVKIPTNNVDLIAKKLEADTTIPSNDWSKIGTNIRFVTEAKNTKDNPAFLAKYPKTQVVIEYTVTAPGYNDSSSYKTVHSLDKETLSSKFMLELPNNPDIPGYTVKLKLTTNYHKDNPPTEVTFDNNVLEKEIFIPTKQKPLPPIPPTIPDPDLKLPLYNLEKLQCYLPENPKTGQKANVLYDTGTYEHEHTPSWVGASNYDPPEPEDLVHLNTGRPTGYKEVVVFGPLCPQKTNAYQQCRDYRDANQKATGFNWWDTMKFQEFGIKERKETERVIFQYRIESIRVRDHDNVLHHGCCGHCTGRDSDGNCTGWYTPPPHYHYHTEYQVKKIVGINMVNNIKVSSVANKTIDHSTQKPITRAGYGVYSQSKISYDTDHTKHNGCCTFDTEAYMFMPHLNKRGDSDPKRIVPMDKTNNKAPYPTDFQTAKNPKSLQKLRKQFIDVDYPDGAYPVNFRYKLRAPNFKPSLHPKGSEIALKNKYPTALPALGICDIGTIQVYGNMWDDVWVHPDDPNTLQRR